MEENKKNINIHSGHRQRMLKKYAKLGSEAFEDHELLEMLLYYSIPVKNTNETAHLLINNCGSLYNTLISPVETISEAEGVGNKSALLVSICGDIVRRADMVHAASVPLNSHERRSRYIAAWFKNKEKSTVMAMFLDKDQRLIDTVAFSVGRRRRSSDYAEDITNTAASLDAKSVILAHNHKDNCPLPSVNDISLTSDIRISLANKGISLIEHYIVTDYECVPISQTKDFIYEEFDPLS